MRVIQLYISPEYIKSLPEFSRVKIGMIDPYEDIIPRERDLYDQYKKEIKNLSETQIHHFLNLYRELRINALHDNYWIVHTKFIDDESDGYYYPYEYKKP